MSHRTKGPTAEAAPATRGSVIRWARLYDLLTNLLSMGRESAVRRLALDLAEVAPGESVLDVGCGTGTLALLAKERVGPGGEVRGIDASPEMIQVAREKAAKARADVDFRLGVAEQLPFEDASYDLVLSSFMLHHLPDDLKRTAFAEIARVLRPGGRLLAVDLSGSGSLLWRLMSLVGHRLPANYAKELSAMMREAGLSAELLPTQLGQYIFIRAGKPAREARQP